MKTRTLMIAALLPLTSCSYPNVYRLLNLSGEPLMVHDVGKNDAWTLPPAKTSRRLQLSDGRRYELARPAEPGCRYTYPSLTDEGIPIPSGRRVVDGREPRTVTLVTVDKDFVIRAYPYDEDLPIDPASEFRSLGFPAKPARTCAGASS